MNFDACKEKPAAAEAFNWNDLARFKDGDVVYFRSGL